MLTVLRRVYLTFNFVSYQNTDYSAQFLAICRRPSICLSVICLSVTFVHPTHAIEIFGNVSMPFGTLAISDLSEKILRRSTQGTPPSGEINTSGVAEYSDFGPIECMSRKWCNIGANVHRVS